MTHIRKADRARFRLALLAVLGVCLMAAGEAFAAGGRETAKVRHGRRSLAASIRKGADIAWVRIPGGSFIMGTDDSNYRFANAKPVHRVAVRPFEMSRTLVTNRQYAACVAAKVCTPVETSGPECGIWDPTLHKSVSFPSRFRGPGQPVVCVNWFQAQAFSKWVGGRLPSEAEWEYAARSAGKPYRYPWGNSKAICGKAVTGICGLSAPAPVCSKPAGNTEQGLCDMAGNVWEWVDDWYHASYAGAPSDGSAWLDPPGSQRVIRGGSWADNEYYVRTALRYNNAPYHRDLFGGFRVAR